MDGRYAVKRGREEPPAIKYGEGIRYNIYRQAQPFNAAAKCKKNDLKTSETLAGKDGASFTGR